MSTFQYAVELEMRRDRDEREQVAAATAAAARCSRASERRISHLSRRPHNNECMRIPSSTDERGFQFAD